MDGGFESYSMQHVGALLAGAVITWGAIRHGQAGDDLRKINLAIILAGLTFSSMLIEAIVIIAEDRYDPRTDLPLYLCDVVALALPFVLYRRDRTWIGIFYFWALAGTLQALLTPDIQRGFPSFAYFKYFITHGGIVAAMLYTIIVWRIRINGRDVVNAIVYAQVYLVFVHLVNSALGSNFSYTLQKPPGPSMLDLLGPWPWYILWGEVLMIVLFLALWLPFLLRPSQGSDRPELTDDHAD